MKNKLSALVVVKNEEKQIVECLQTVKFADEIIVILDSCTDKTEERSKTITKNCFKGAWKNEGERRNFGISKCTNKWILEIDADERVPRKLQLEILQTINISKDDFHNIPVDNYIGKRLVKYGWGAYFGKSAYPGLFKKNKKKWGFQNVHPKIIFSGSKGKSLENSITHYYCKDVFDMFVKLDKYSDARSIDLKKFDLDETLSKNVKRIFSRFWKCFILRKGYREKDYGFLIAIISAIYPILSFLKFKYTNEKNSVHR